MADGPTSLDDFTPEQLKALQDIAQARVDNSLSRRDALKALGMVGAGAAVGAGGSTALTEPAKADASTTDSDGDVGAPNDPVDVFADGVEIHNGPNNPIGTLDENGLDIPTVSTDYIDGRPLATDGATTINVPSDVSFDALPGEVARYIGHKLTISLDAGDHSDKILYIPSFVTLQADTGDSNSDRELVVLGDETTPSNVKIGGVYMSGAYGKRPVVGGLQYEDAVPASDNSSSFQISDGMVLMRNCNFNNASGNANRCITAYGGGVLFKYDIDAGTDDYLAFCVVKNQGAVTDETITSDGDLTGSVTGDVWYIQNATMAAVDRDTSITAGDEFIRNPDRGPVFSFSGTGDLSETRMHGPNDWESENHRIVHNGSGYYFRDEGGGVNFWFQDQANGVDHLLAGKGTFGILAKDLSSNPGGFGEGLASHDGSDGNPEGYYRWEPGNNQWVKVEDNSITISA